jgi:hypothetical protein
MNKILPALTLLLLTSSAAFAQFAPSTENLRGLTGVRLITQIGHYPHRMEEAQKPEILKLVGADAAAKLEKAGMPFFASPSDPRRNATYAVLVITLTINETMDGTNETKHIETEVKLLQRVRLSRDPSIEFDAVTWITGGSVTGPKQLDLNGQTRNQVAGEIDRFIQDYSSVNAKPSAASSSSKVVIRP